MKYGCLTLYFKFILKQSSQDKRAALSSGYDGGPSTNTIVLGSTWSAKYFPKNAVYIAHSTNSFNHSKINPIYDWNTVDAHINLADAIVIIAVSNIIWCKI